MFSTVLLGPELTVLTSVGLTSSIWGIDEWDGEEKPLCGEDGAWSCNPTDRSVSEMEPLLLWRVGVPAQQRIMSPPGEDVTSLASCFLFRYSKSDTCMTNKSINHQMPESERNFGCSSPSVMSETKTSGLFTSSYWLVKFNHLLWSVRERSGV